LPTAQKGGGGGDNVLDSFIPSIFTFANDDVEKRFNEMKLNDLFVMDMALNHFMSMFLIPFAKKISKTVNNVNIFKHYSCISAERSKRSVVFRTSVFTGTTSQRKLMSQIITPWKTISTIITRPRTAA
jgi:hypothetical protein